MFSGIVQDLGEVVEVNPTGIGNWSFAVQPKGALAEPGLFSEGDSISVNGVCLTLVNCKDQRLVFYTSPETLAKSSPITLSSYVNLESALTVGSQLNGHWVTGHIDGTATVNKFERVSETGSWFLEVSPPLDLMPFLAFKGAVSLDGVSLTVNSVTDSTFTVNIIPYTYEHTIASNYHIGSSVNIEVDIWARYAFRGLQHYLAIQKEVSS